MSSPFNPRSTSIVIGTYNGARFVEAQLESLIRQTVAPIEIIVADDQSSDDTPTIVQAFARRSPVPVRFAVNETNLGFGENFLRAATHATGDLVAFCDQDDVWRHDKVALCAAAFDDPASCLRFTPRV